MKFKRERKMNQDRNRFQRYLAIKYIKSKDNSFFEKIYLFLIRKGVLK